MSRARILYQISGSIAAYKSAVVISKLVQSGCELQVVATPAALHFIGAATLEGLTGKPVLSDMFESGRLMDHINLIKWADLVLLAPATANTINRLSQGLADDLIGALFLAHDWSKPYLLAPAMNTKMYAHPATQSSMNQLKEWGVNVLPTADGYLACGDEGQGKLLDPVHIVNAIMQALPDQPGKRVLITSGGTREAIDAVRFMTNMSTGRTGATLADAFIRKGYSVTLLHGAQSIVPELMCEKVPYSSSKMLEDELKEILSIKEFEVVIHLAAVSDFLPETLVIDQKKHALPVSDKLPSTSNTLSINFRQNGKLLNKIKGFSKNNAIKLVAFKLTAGANKTQQKQAVVKLFQNSSCDLVVANDMQDRRLDNQASFHLYDSIDTTTPIGAVRIEDLAASLINNLFKKQEINS